MVRDRLTGQILGILKPRRKDWNATLKARQLDGIYAVMLWTVVGALQCRALLEKWDTKSRRHLYDLDAMFENLRQALTPSGDLKWNQGENFLDWSTGYFLNRAEHNICSAFDRILSAWIGHKAKWNLSKEDSEDIWYISWPSNRTKILNMILAKEGKKNRNLDSVTDAFGSQNLAYTSVAVEELKKLAKKLYAVRSRPLNQFYQSVDKHGAACLALVWGRTNAFKHQVKTGTLLHSNRNLALRTEWAVSVRALLFVGLCWRAMLRDVIKKPLRRRRS